MPRILYVLPVLAVLAVLPAVLPAAHAQADDGHPPTLVFADYHRGNGVLTLEFHETVDIDSVDLGEISITNGFSNFGLSGMTVTTTGDSDTVTVQLTGFWKNRVNAASPNVNTVIVNDGFADDLNGNQTVEHSHEFGVRTDPPDPPDPPDTTPPGFVSAVIDRGDEVATITFDEELESGVNRFVFSYMYEGFAVVFQTSQTSPGVLTRDLPRVELARIDESTVFTFPFGSIRDLSGNIAPVRDFTFTIIDPPPDTTPPVLVSATLDTDSGTATIVFDEAIDPNYAIVDFTLDGETIGVEFDVDAASPNVITKRLDDRLVSRVGDWTASVGDSLSDIHGNFMPATDVRFDVIEPVPLNVVSGTYETSSGRLTIVFSETIDFSETDPAGIRLGQDNIYTLADHSDFDGTGPDSDTIAVRMSSDFRDGFEPAADTAHLVILHHAVVDLNGNSNDSMLIFDIPVHAGGGQGSEKDHLKKPTFGTYELTHEQAVSCGYSMDGVCRDVADYHVDYERETIQAGSAHDFALKAYSPIGYLAQFQIAFGVPEVGSSISEAEAVITVDLARNYTEPSTYQVAGVSYLNENSVIGEDATVSVELAQCMPGFSGDCLQVSIDGVLFRERMHHEPFAIFAMDRDRRTATHYMNEGITIQGESLNPAMQANAGIRKQGNQHEAQPINLVRTDKLADLWADQWGNTWTKNSFDTWRQVTPDRVERVQDHAWNVMTRLHSDFGTLVQSEQDRALLVFDSSYIQSWPGPAFAREIPEGAYGDGARLARLAEAIISEQQRAQDLLDRTGTPPA